MKKTILGSFAAAALVSGAVMAAPCDPCCDVTACDPCGPCNTKCDPCDDVCGPCDDVCGPKRSKLKVYTDVAAIVGNVDGGFSGYPGTAGYTMAGGLKATLGFQRGKNAVEVGYTGLYNNVSESYADEKLYANYNAVDVNFVRTLERNKNLKAFVGIGYANFSQAMIGENAGGPWNESFANDMAGFHVGGKWSRSARRAGIEAYGKLGVYANTATYTDKLDATNNENFGNCRGAWVAAGGVNLTYKLTKRTTAFVGYDVTKIEGVERGGWYYGTSTQPASGGVLVQGFVFGAKAAF